MPENPDSPVSSIRGGGLVVHPTVADTAGESSIRIPQADTSLGAGFGEGISMRLEMLGGAINTASYNNALQVAAPVYGVQYFKMAGPQPKCEYCIKYYGRIYRQGMFMPEFPAHPNCFHTWDVWFPWEKESEFAAFWNRHTQPQLRTVDKTPIKLKQA